MAYVLAELDTAGRRGLISAAAGCSRTVVVVEPGTPAGYQRVLQARSQLVEAGLQIVAPCPHQHRCPLQGTRDWCHFSVRLNRSTLHRHIKGASLGHEDEKFSYVAASRDATGGSAGRVIRRPRTRKGLVEMDVCTAEYGIQSVGVTKSHGPAYRVARRTDWGDAWTPSDEDGAKLSAI